MSAIQYKLTIEQGATFDQVVTVKTPAGAYKDLTGYSARMKVKESPGDTVALLSLTSPSSGGQGIDLGTTNGQIRIRIPAAVTAALSFYVAYYDLEIVAGTGEVTRVMQGQCILSREVTS